MTTPTLALARRTDVLVGLGVALMSAAIALSFVYSRREDDLDWSNFGVGVAATGVLLLLAVAGLLGFADADVNASLASWPLAFGALGTGLMVAVAMDFDKATPWFAGLVVTVIGAAGYAAVRRPAPALAAVVGLAVLYVKILDTTINDAGDDGLILVGAAVLAFTVAISVGAWFLGGRDVVAISVGAVAVFVYSTLLTSYTALGFFYGGLSGEDYDSGYDAISEFRDDVYWLLFFAFVLVVVWGALSLLTGHVGYRVLIVAITTSQLPLSIAALNVDHPSVVGLALVVIAALLLAAAVAGSPRAVRGGEEAAPETTPPPPYTP